MRVTESMMFNQMSNDVNNSSSNYQSLEQELATGRKINQPSDDPAGASQAMTVRSMLVNISQYQTDATNATNFMQNTDSQLNSVQNLVTQARTIGVAAANGATQDPGTIAANVTELNSIISQITTIANSDFAGEKVFSGQQTSTNAYTDGDTTHTYNGDDGALMANIGNGNSVQINVPGDKVFGPAFTALQQLVTDVQAGDATAISTNDLPAIDSASSTISDTRATVGSTIDQVSNTSSLLSSSQLNYQNSLTSIEDVDIATTYSQLQIAQNVYQASLVSVQGALKYSLADYIQ